MPTNNDTRLEVIRACSFELATNFDCPSEQILGVYGAKLGLTSREMFNLLSSEVR